jgi:hypothetical protein
MSKVCKRGDTNESGTVYKELKDMFKVSRISKMKTGNGYNFDFDLKFLKNELLVVVVSSQEYKFRFHI